MTVAQIIDQIRGLDPGELIALRHVIDGLADASRPQPPEQPRRFHTVPVDMGVPLDG
ncbi:MAG: hypothetical protein LBK42_07695 [Propionibacteriaceae bacterium]|jgi:hypothetical protein|nr:hypothetical protein [Propionibacteriaceae bacterium]